MWAGSVVPVSLHSSAKGRWKFLFSVPLHSFVKGTWRFPCSFSFFFLLKGDGNFHVPNLGSLSGYRNMEISMCLYVVLHKGTWKFPCMSLQKRAHWKTLPVKSGVAIRLCEQKRGFKDYRRFRSLMNFIAVNYSHTFKRQCRNNKSRLPLF